LVTLKKTVNDARSHERQTAVVSANRMKWSEICLV